MKTTRGRGEEVTEEMILERMASGDKLTLARLAARLKMSEDKVRRKLLLLVSQGKVKRERDGITMSDPYLYFVDCAPIAGGEFEIPTPFIGVNMTGELTGFAAEMERRAALCMLVRRYA